MTFESQTCICFRHTFTIVYHLDAGLSGICHRHINMSGTGIYGILHQFLYDGSRPLYHLSRSYLIGYGIGQQTDYIAHKLCFSSIKSKSKTTGNKIMKNIQQNQYGNKQSSIA